ncbi:reductive dehalogenase [Sulfurospirillum sp.]|nr:reductive dehalogenase [Sulfurospirillum sp.]
MLNNKPELSRRDFGKLVAGASATITMAPFGRADASPVQIEKASNEIRRKYTLPDGSFPIKVNDDIKQISEDKLAFYNKSTIFVKNHKGERKHWFPAWIDKREYFMKNSMHGPDIPAPSVADARTGRSFEAAGWVLNNILGKGKPNRDMYLWDHIPTESIWSHVYEKEPDEKDPVKLTNQIKYMARMSGADLVGCAPLNKTWMYSNVYTTIEKGSHKTTFKPMTFGDVEKPTETDEKYIIPHSINNVIVSAFAMNREMFQTAPASLAMASASFGYSRMAAHDMWMSAFIRNQGYFALPCANGLGQSVAFATEAGLGQPSRMGLLITPEFGPLVRLTKIFTNMPLIHDKPIDFGVTTFCETCKKCARDCPSKAITEGPRSYEARDIHNQAGKLQWMNDHKKCFSYWHESAGDCGVCVATCPFSKGNIWIHDGVEWLIDNARFLDPVMLGMDEALGYGAKRNVEEVLNGKINTYGLDTDHFQDTETTIKERVRK